MVPRASARGTSGAPSIGGAGVADFAGAVHAAVSDRCRTEAARLLGEDRQPGVRDYLQYPTYTYSDAQTQVWFATQFVTTIRPARWTSSSLGEDQRVQRRPGFRFLEPAVNGSFDWYTKNTSDLIFTVRCARAATCPTCSRPNIGA